MVGHTDGPSVDQSKPKIHVYVKMDGTLIIILKTNKDDSHQIIGRQGSFTMLLPGDEDYIKHGRKTTMAPGSNDFAITLVLRLMHPQKGTSAAAEVMSGATVLTTPNQVSDWENLADSKILTCRTIMGPVPKDRSVRQILEQNPGLLIPAIRGGSHFSPGDIITSSAGSEMLSIEPSVLMGSVKGSSAAGGAVAIYLSHNYVTILERSTVVGGTVRFIFRCGKAQAEHHTHAVVVVKSEHHSVSYQHNSLARVEGTYPVPRSTPNVGRARPVCKAPQTGLVHHRQVHRVHDSINARCKPV